MNPTEINHRLESINRNLRRLGIPPIERVHFEYQQSKSKIHDMNLGLMTICMVSNAVRSQWPIIGLGASKKSRKDHLDRAQGRRHAFEAALQSYTRQGKKIAEKRKQPAKNEIPEISAPPVEIPIPVISPDASYNEWTRAAHAYAGNFGGQDTHSMEYLTALSRFRELNPLSEAAQSFAIHTELLNNDRRLGFEAEAGS